MRKAVEDAPSLEIFIQNLPGNVYRRVRRPDGTYRFEYLSSGLFRQFDVDNERLLAQDPVLFDWVHPEDRARFIADLEMSAATLGILDHRTRVIGADGRAHWARGIARPSRRPDGSVVWDGIVIDVTREVEAQSALMVAKIEAERAHASSAQFIAEAAERLSRPVSALHALVEELRPTLPAQTIARFVDLLGSFEIAFREIRPDRAREHGAPPQQRTSGLTDRQLQVLALMKLGMTNKQIAQKLGITPGTTKLHVAAILRAMNASSRREIVRAQAA